MNERGFFTIVGLCLLLAVALSIRGVQEFEGNYSIGTTNSLAEFELQNFADSGIYERITGTKYFHSDKLGEVTVEVRRYSGADYIRRYEGRYEYVNFSLRRKDYPVKNGNGDDFAEPATILLSVASCASPNVDGKIYRKSMAYVLKDGTVYFLTNL